MFQRTRNFLRSRLPDPTIVYAKTRALFSRRKLPPGKLVPLDQIEKANRPFLLQQAAAFGPVVKGLWWGRLVICVVGLPVARRLLREHGDDLKPTTMDVSSLFPVGLMRQMEGEAHRRYRKALVRAIRPENLAAGNARLDAIASRALADYATNSQRNGTTPEAYIAALREISTGMLIDIFFGVEPGSELFERLRKGYEKLGPNGLVWTIGAKQKEAFFEIRDCLLALFASDPAASSRSVAAEMKRDGIFDEVVVGNLIYMVEMGRYDVYSLFRWLTKYSADHPRLLERIALEDVEPAPEGRPFVNAFVQETLRMNQSERLGRKAARTFVFDGHLIPKYALVRVCLWEAHKMDDAFPEPYRFDPERFLGRMPSSDDYSPFGLDQHNCPASDMTIQMSTVFLRALARTYTIAPLENDVAVRGTYHWEPAGNVPVKLLPRATGAQMQMQVQSR